ncbi:UDP-N-acetylmuramoyl-L-alanyl-D-glutamate--2,6-diaminopimelate ligase [Buchnera aphidicola]|uniref:UDP-N-acetylmuramoyl-L-alanyl-D-glutamate--2,6-diaminopimelate ligase n=1 Tax=Buchnera aphidicola str. USDA (Myzus persicae) TaxID=1009856 RepID=W0P517_BUCMP|nr:UDP-N-acetylmuramoyl-L-alanyl-D-glutamate--2,6-diaminopimelate ligase [Buchnera aphidicola]AHG60153.1 Mure [Buchnera aphidicola str. USDA (Myzus persicae)]AHG60733.1 Mure [Buchnera aphidicola str. W106 (Myzus persicae)]AHG61305.1 Mure [Buchnera aphidicola str. G002 (Myzus persicae)]AHG61878.1 Mure [Buchnera aphidicola str. F009 (Myzus persicae)]WAI03156.1 MAG: UDP-N-acetylmuramoyl-L-alanyl-D-glutamate--2,6-diaminopimelate ligase [Buchnera aphidicola (Myzus persicae)]
MNYHCLKHLLLPWMKNIPKKNIIRLQIDSRKLTTGDLFIAIPGTKKDGRDFIDEAINKKVAAILCETKKTKEHGIFKYIKNVLIIFFFKLSENISILASRFYQEPAKKLKIIGVTGTNGKTTVTQLINQWNNILGNTSATMGTLGNGFYNSLYKTKNTTSSAICIQSFLQTVLEKKIKLVTMEISSHGLIQNRVKGIPFYIAIFTNLTQDHLDYHLNMEKYEKAKWLLFSKYKVKKIILNADDQYGKIWLKKLVNKYTIAVTIQDCTQKKYSTKWINATHIKLHNNSMHIKFESSWGTGQLSSSLIGRFNVINLLLSLACLLELDYNLSDLINTSVQIIPIDGRMQIFNAPKKPIFIIDYAHTPDALKQTLSAIRLHYRQKYIWCIFGCGGERDSKKRSIMGAIAEEIADNIIITNDNPRNEKEMQIINDILSGCREKKKILIIKNRKKAICYAFFQSKNNHIIFIAGKGHEEKQVIGNKNINYSDKKIVLDLLEKKI